MTGRMIPAVFGTAAFLLLSFQAPPAAANSTDIAEAVETAFTACHAWVMNPDSWSDDIAGFPKTIGLGGQMQQRETVPADALPPETLREGAIYWRVTAGKGDLYLTVSVSQPICRMAGGGPDDWQPGVEKGLASKAFLAIWAPSANQIPDQPGSDIRLTRYASTDELGFSLMVTRAAAPGGPAKPIQFLATARLR